MRQLSQMNTIKLFLRRSSLSGKWGLGDRQRGVMSSPLHSCSNCRGVEDSTQGAQKIKVPVIAHGHRGPMSPRTAPGVRPETVVALFFICM
jgi:hypothetical protein